jgi:predicted GIY-YIG superfamily endonuclease
MFSIAPVGLRIFLESSAMTPRYFVYVVLLGQGVLIHKKFKDSNPNYLAGQPCVYVGMTGKDPDTRFDQHKAGVKSNRWVREYGERLMMELVDDLKQPMTYEDAKYQEVDVAIRLREQGFGVWQA